MPDARLTRTRESLPEGYRFGDAIERCNHDYRARRSDFLPGYQAICEICGHDAGVVELRGMISVYGNSWKEGQDLTTTWRRPSENAAEQLTRKHSVYVDPVWHRRQEDPSVYEAHLTAAETDADVVVVYFDTDRDHGDETR